jgi:AraC-like DNA-binding protein
VDPLSDVLSLLKPRSYMFRGFDVGGAWSIQFRRHKGVKCFALGSGACWLVIEDVEEAIRLEAGDCFLLPRGRGFRLASDVTLKPVDAEAVFSGEGDGEVATVNGGGDLFGVGGHFAFGGEHAEILLGMLPPIIHIRAEHDREALRWSVDRLMREMREPRPGGSLIAQQLTSMILVQALRLHLAEQPSAGVGWLFALADKQLSAAIGAIHRDPGRRWTLQALADIAGMSRSTFALRFKGTTGVTPIDYLVRWRMLLAGERLTQSSQSVAAVALSLSYESESAFCTAFKRVMGCSPRRYAPHSSRRTRRSLGSDAGEARRAVDVA